MNVFGLKRLVPNDDRLSVHIRDRSGNRSQMQIPLRERYLDACLFEGGEDLEVEVARDDLGGRYLFGRPNAQLEIEGTVTIAREHNVGWRLVKDIRMLSCYSLQHGFHMFRIAAVGDSQRDVDPHVPVVRRPIRHSSLDEF